MRYDYRAVDNAGTLRIGTEDANSENELVAKLLRLGLAPLMVKPAIVSERISLQPIMLLRQTGGLNLETQSLVVRELAALLRSGVTLEESLRTLIESHRGNLLEVALTKILTEVLAGQRFSVALKVQTETRMFGLPPYVVALVAAGESTGDLAGALARAADQMEFDRQLRAETIEALIYPMILVIAGAAAVLFVFSFVVPRFSTLLAGRRADLPWISTVVLGIGEYVNGHGAAIGGASFGILVTSILGWRSLGPARTRSALSRLPLFGAWIRQQEISRWTGMLALMLQSRVPILVALDLTANAVTLDDVGRRLRAAMAAVSRGEQLSRALATLSLLPASSLSMVRVGERTGQLGTMIGHVASQALEHNRRLRRRLVALIEPAAIVALGGIIAIVIVGVVLALSSLSDVRL